MAILDREIDSLSDFVKAIEEMRDDAGVELWYRGVSNTSYKLSPTLFRHKDATSARRVDVLEKEVIEDFKFRYQSYISFSERDDWDLLFLMQHYRIPTRLLDWSSSPFAGLFFALDGNTGGSNSVVWILDPREWNRGMFDDIGGDSKIYSTSDNEIDQYHPDLRTKSARSEPIAIQGQVNNPRITAQKGKFVVFGQKVSEMEAFEKSFANWNRNPLARLIIPKAKVLALKQAIFEFGITHTSIYPDVEGLAMEIRYKHGFAI